MPTRRSRANSAWRPGSRRPADPGRAVRRIAPPSWPNLVRPRRRIGGSAIRCSPSGVVGRLTPGQRWRALSVSRRSSIGIMPSASGGDPFRGVRRADCGRDRYRSQPAPIDRESRRPAPLAWRGPPNRWMRRQCPRPGQPAENSTNPDAGTARGGPVSQGTDGRQAVVRAAARRPRSTARSGPRSLRERECRSPVRLAATRPALASRCCRGAG